MGQVAVITGSEVRTWSVTTTTGYSDFSIIALSTHGGPFEPGTKQTIANAMQFRNDGVGVARKFALKFGYNDGTGWQTMCSVASTDAIAPGECASWGGYEPDFTEPCLAAVPLGCDQAPAGKVLWNMPDQYNVTEYFAIKVWGADEDEPGWPSLAMIKAGKGKRRTGMRRAGLSGNQKGAIAGVTGAVVGGLVGYAVARR